MRRTAFLYSRCVYFKVPSVHWQCIKYSSFHCPTYLPPYPWLRAGVHEVQSSTDGIYSQFILFFDTYCNLCMVYLYFTRCWNGRDIQLEAYETDFLLYREFCDMVLRLILAKVVRKILPCGATVYSNLAWSCTKSLVMLSTTNFT